MIIDNETGEVLDGGDRRAAIYAPDENSLVARTDAELVALSEAALAYTVAELDAVTLEDAPKMRAQTQALDKMLAAHLRSKEAKLEATNNLTEARLRIERHVGALIPQMRREGLLIKNGGDRKSVYPDGKLISSLDDHAITYKNSATWQKVARVEPDIFEDYVATGKENAWELSTAGLLWYARQQAAAEPDAPPPTSAIDNLPGGAELWARDRLGQTAGLVYARLTITPQSAPALAEATGKHRRTVHRALTRLAVEGLAERARGGWIVGTASAATVARDWDAPAQRTARERVIETERELHRERLARRCAQQPHDVRKNRRSQLLPGGVA